MVKKSHFLAQAALSSLLFCTANATLAFTNLDTGANGQVSTNPAYLPATGYNFVAPNVLFAIANGNVVGNTGGISVDNNNGNNPAFCGGSACTNDTIYFINTGTVTGSIGNTNAVPVVGIEGGLVSFLSTPINVGTTANQGLIFAGNGTGQFINGVVINGIIDNDNVPNNGNLTFQGGGLVTGPGNIGITLPLANINFNTVPGGANTLELDGTTIRLLNINAVGDGINASTLRLNNQAGGMTLTTPNGITTNNNDIDNVLITNNGTSTLNTNIGAVGNAFDNVTIENGSNIINGTIVAVNTMVTAGGTLVQQNPETVTGNFTLNPGSGAILSFPNTSVLTVNGTGIFTVNNGTTLAYNLAGGITTGEVDATKAQVAGGVVNISNPPVNLPAGTIIIPLVSGGATSVITQLPVTGVQNTLLRQYSTKADNVNHMLDLVITSESFGLLATESNTIPVAQALDSIFDSGIVPQGELFALLQQQTFFTSQEQFNQALATLAPIVDGGVVYESFNVQEATFDALTDRLDEVHYGLVSPYPWQRPLGVNGGDFTELGRGNWLKVFGQNGHQTRRDGIAGYKDTIWGVEGGTDVALSEKALVGIAGSWGHTHLNHHVSDATTRANSFQATLYGHYYFDNPYFLHWYAGAAYNHYTTERNIFFGNLSFAPRSKYHAWQGGAKAEIGYVCGQKSFHTVPLASLYYSHLALHGTTETGAGTLNQQIQSHDYNLLKAGAGIKFVYDYGDTYTATTFQPEVHALLYYDLISDRMQTTSLFTGGGPSFVTLGARTARGSLDLGGSVTAFKAAGLIMTAHYDHQIRENYFDNSGFLRLRYEW